MPPSLRSIAVACLMAPTAALAGSQLPDTPQSLAHAQTCKHFENRAKFQPRHTDSTLEVLLAESCARAFESLYARIDTSPYESRHAEELLIRLGAFKNTFIAMNMDRMFGKNRTKFTQIQSALGEGQAGGAPVQPVTETGEYLIARQMGVIGAFRAWADVTEFELVEER